MNILPIKSDAVQVPSKAKPKAEPNGTESTDAPGQEKVGRKERLIQALASEPAVRSDVLERARRLAADPDYPPADVLEKLAEKFIGDAKNLK